MKRYLIEYDLIEYHNMAYRQMIVAVDPGMGEKDRAIQSMFKQNGVPPEGTIVYITELDKPMKYRVQSEWSLEKIK